MKKALSVFLSLLMVITTISVVFTLPTSAATVVLFSENFDSMTAGEAITFATTVPEENGWFKAGGSAAAFEPAANTATHGETFTAPSGSMVLRMTNWGSMGYVINVEPNTTYTVKATTYSFSGSSTPNSAITAVDITGASGKLSSLGSLNRGGVKDSNNVEYRGTTANRSITSTMGSWVVERTVTFTTSATAEKYYIAFTQEHNSYSGIDSGFFVDDFSITYEVKPTVKTTTYGADNKNGGVAWVDTAVSASTAEGTAITYKAMPYDSAVFDGWYVDGVKVSSETTLTRNWVIAETVEAKFKAVAKNLWPELENRTTFNTNGVKYTGNASYAYANGRTVTHTIIDKDLLTGGTPYGLSGTVSNAKAYSGKLSFTPPSAAGHRSYQIVKVEPNTDYTLTFWYYQDSAVLFSGINSNAHIGSINLDLAMAAGNPYAAETGEAADATIIRVTSGGNGTFTDYTDAEGNVVQRYFINTTWSNTKVTGQWAKATATFTSDELGWAVVQFGGGNTVYLDHFTLYEAPKAITPTVSSESNFGSNDGIVYDVTDVYYEGDTFQATAMPYDNAKFVGFYVDDVKVESGVTENANGSYTATLTYNAGKTYTAKFHAYSANIWPADPAPSSTTPLYKGTGHTTPKAIGANDWTGQSYATIYNVDNDYIATLGSGLKAFAGDTAYYFGSHNGHNAYRVVRGLKTNTDYTLTYWVYDNGISTNKNTAGQVVDVTTTNPTINDNAGSGTVHYGITGIATGATHIEVGDMYIKVGSAAATYPQVRPTQSTVSKNPVQNAWYRVERTFNTGANTDFLINFGNAEIQIVMYDHISLYEQPVAIDLEALVQVDKGGYNNVGLVQTEGEVYIDGDEFTVAATPYANATLDGLYVDGKKVENGVVKNLTTTYELTYKAGSTYVVKFNAFAENIFPDASFEGITPSISTKFVNSPAPSVGNAENPILSNGWMASVYGHAYVATGSQLSSIEGFENVTAYAGNNVLYTACAHHQAYRLLNVEANSNYKMIYYVYAPEGAALSVNYVYGIKAEGDTVTWADMNPKHGGETGQSQIAVTVNDYAAAAGQWVKREVTFNTGAHTRVLIPFGSKPVLFDHVTVYRLPNPTTVSIGVAGGNLVVGDKYASTLSYELGEQVTVTAEPYANTGNTFLGWYTDASCTGDAFSTEATLSVTATDGGTYFAKFKNNSIVADSGFENLAIGEITSQGATTGFYTSNAKIYVTDTVTNHDNLSAYAGNNMLKVNSAGGTVYYNVGAVRPYTSYIVSFKVLLPEEGQEVSDWRQGATKIVGFAGVRSIDARIGDASLNQYKDIVPINGNQYEYEENKITYHTISEGENGTWKQVTAIVNSYEFDELKIGFGYNGTTSTNVDISMYVDDFTVVEAVNATASVETLNPFGDEASAQVGGYAYAKNSYTQAAISGSGNATGVTLVATPVNGGVFLGWYQGENKVSSETTYECEITEATSFVAKFAYNGFEDVISSAENLLTFDGSFEEYETGALVINVKQPIGYEDEEKKVPIYHPTSGAPIFNRGSENFTLGSQSEWGRIFATNRYAYDGSNSLYLNTGCNASFIMKLGESGTPSALETNTKYVLSFYYFYPKSADYNDDGNPDFYIQQIGIVEEGFELTGSGAISSYLDSKEDANGKKLLYGAFHQGETVYGEWTKVEIPFTTTETAGATLSLTATAGTKNTEQRIYLDKFELKKANVYETAASTAFNNSVERGGVAIRVPNAEGTVTQALRFKARIAKERLEAMTLGANYTVVEYGSLAMNAAYIEGNTDVEKANNLTIGYTNGSKNVVKGVTYSADKGTNRVFAYKPGEKDLIFTAALTGIGKKMEGDNLAKAYKTDYIVRTYAILRLADGTEVTVYDNVDEDDTFSASIYRIAKLAVDDPEVDQTTKTYLQKQIIDICEAAPEEGVASSYSVFYNGSGLADKTNIENFFVDENITINGDKGTHANSRPVYYSSDKTIRNYTGNTLTLSAKEGYYISSVVITTTEDEPYAATTSTGVATTDGTTTTIEGINSAEFVLTATAKMFITGITVNYKYGVAPDPVIPEEPEPEEPEDENVTNVVPSDLGLTNEAKIENVDTGAVLLNGAQGTHSNNQPKYFSSDNTIRAYEGNTLTFTAQATSTYGLRSVAAGRNIDYVVITFKSGYADDALSVSIGTKSDIVDNVITISEINARELTLTFSKTTRILSIDVRTEETVPCETHEYTDNCDVECNVCYAVRNDAPHAFVSDCDTTCECGATREALVAHTADACATVCELCGEAVVPTHKFAGDCDTTCDCGETKEPTAEHNYVDGACDVCGAIEPVSCTHEYDNGCDAECNICFAIREDLTHIFASDCDTKCEYCEETREALADHSYTHVCSTECTACGFVREADHVYNDGFCECGKPQPTEVTTTLSIADYATANSWADSTKYTEVKVNEYITATAIGGGNTGKYYTNGNNWRIYQGESGKVTLTAAAGYTIVSVKFTYTNDKGGVFKYNDATAASGSVIAINNTTATFVAGNTGSATKGQVRITDIEVTYDIIPECAEEDHVYANDCATECSVCGKDRVAPHAYVSDCDTTCECGATREALADHTTDDACKTACDLCGEAVVATHKYAGDCDTTCECGATREALSNHTYTDDCDADCDVCGFVRDEIPHVWTDGYDAECDNCGETRIPPLSCEHTYTDDCDADCDNCGVERAEIPHKFAGACDATCDCGATQEVTADHTYADDCDADCDVCGATRVAPHQYEFACSDTCICGATRTPADHTYGEDGFCECGEKKPTQVTVDKTMTSYGWANQTKVTNFNVDENISATVAKNGGSTDPAYYTSGTNLRVYAKNKLTLTAAEGYEIISVTLTCSSGYLPTTAMGAGTGSISGTKITFTNINAATWILTNSGSSQIRITGISVTYGLPCDHTADQFDCDAICDACGMAVEPTADHTYVDGCDVDCDVCGTVREPIHDDDVLCDTICSNCRAEVEAKADHVYDDDNDAICNNCNFERVLASECTHEYDNNCDADCNLCDYVREVSDHVYADDCDENCDECNATRTAPHKYEFDCSTECTCGATREASHSYVDGACEYCGEDEPAVSAPLATFNLGANGNTKHADGSSKTSYTETVDGYTLSLTNVSNFYTGARDAKGNGAIKLGASSKTGGFSFTVGADVNKVVIYVAGYKAKTVSVKVGSETHKITVTSDNGEYQAIEIDTTTNKTVTLETTSTGYRAMVNTIEFWA